MRRGEALQYRRCLFYLSRASRRPPFDTSPAFNALGTFSAWGRSRDIYLHWPSKRISNDPGAKDREENSGSDFAQLHLASPAKRKLAAVAVASAFAGQTEEKTIPEIDQHPADKD